MDKWIRLAHPFFSDNIEKKVGEVIRSGNLVQGEKAKQFEESIAGYLGIENAIATSSGTSALHLSLLALGIGRGDEVIVPAYTFLATVNVVEMVGATPVFVDIGYDYCIDPLIIEDKITERTKAIIVVHEFGVCADMNPIMKLAEKYKLKVIEDAACALGAKYHRSKAGTIGHVGCFSFHPRKIITTGEGGVIVTSDSEMTINLRALRNHGIGEGFYFPGLNYRMTEISAVLGLDQLTMIDEIIKTRAHQARYYDTVLGARDDFWWITRTDSHQSYCIETSNKNFVSDMRSHGIETGRASWGICETNYYKQKYKSECPIASYMHHNLYSLPIGTHLSLKEIDYICQKVKLCK